MGELPECLTFFEMYGIHTLEELKAAERWKTHRTEQSLKAVIGQKAGCKDCILDVHEKYHGPHGLNRRNYRFRKIGDASDLYSVSCRQLQPG